ncbi:hypothetical protein [Effusibacillus pohliae]|uniref:hypothetical protein n=1 Tax=Effusibacillus pohliae TaxID=232270 RepID=UPI000379EC3C|nr:hypothetical protein [Effusibacillus pohliae]
MRKVKLLLSVALTSMILSSVTPLVTAAQPTCSKPAIVITDETNQSWGSNVSRVYNWHSAKYDFTGAKVIVVNRNLVDGPSTALAASKEQSEKYDEQAFNKLANSPFIANLREALNNGAMIVFHGNEDKKLNDSLVYKLFNVTGPVETHSDNFQAVAIYKPAGQQTTSLTAFYYNKKVSTDQIVKDAVKHFNTGNQSPSIMTVQPQSTTPGGGSLNGSGNYFYYSNLYTCVDGLGNTVGQLKVYTELQRGYHDSTYSKWEIKNSGQTQALNAGTIKATWFGVTNNYSGQKILQSLPDTTNPTLTIGATWNYSLPAVYVTHSWSGYTSAGWNHDYKPGSSASTSTYTYQPGLIMDNTWGNLVVAMDNVLTCNETVWDPNLGWTTATLTTGDEYDTLYVPDF